MDKVEAWLKEQFESNTSIECRKCKGVGHFLNSPPSKGSYQCDKCLGAGVEAIYELSLSKGKLLALVRVYRTKMNAIGFNAAQGNSFIEISELVKVAYDEAEEIIDG